MDDEDYKAPPSGQSDEEEQDYDDELMENSSDAGSVVKLRTRRKCKPNHFFNQNAEDKDEIVKR